MSLSFSWGFSPKTSESEKPPVQFSQTTEQQIEISQAHQQHQQQQLQQQLQQLQRHKRRHADDDNSSPPGSPSPSRLQQNRKKYDRFRVSKQPQPQQQIQQQQMQTQQTYKRSRAQVSRIAGHPLPTTRMLEVLDKSQLEQLINNLLQVHPEISQDLNRCSPRPNVEACIGVLESKVRLIEDALPYKVDSASEYAYLRVKPLIEDFLAALSDYTLGFLPPVETVPGTSLEFLDSATLLLHRLPHFDKLSNNYFKDLAYEQLGHTWCMCLREFVTSVHAGVLGLMNNNWEAKIARHNEMSQGKLQSVVDMFKDEMKWLNDEERESSPLKNFSVNNSPCGVKGQMLMDRPK